METLSLGPVNVLTSVWQKERGQRWFVAVVELTVNLNLEGLKLLSFFC